MKRASGILMHITSLPSKYGIGTLGKEAYDFVDFLASAGQHYWQVLPITPTNYGDSPYQSSSVFAFNPYMIDFNDIEKMGLISKDEYDNEFYGSNPLCVDYAALFYAKNKALKHVWKNHKKYDKEFKEFCNKNKMWLSNYALYEAIKESFGYISWQEWPDEYKKRDKKTLDQFRRTHKDEIGTKKFIQWIFYYEWQKLKNYANKKGVLLIGDMPIYVALDSADCWANPDMFLLDEDLKPIKVAGCPPDAFSVDGQLWGNPLYRWDLMKDNNYKWWVTRSKKAFEMFDVVRIDHFRGFAGYYTIPYGDTTARNGKWVTGPGYDLFKAINKKIPNAQIIAENLGFLDESVHELLNSCGYPGMYITQFDFGNGYDYHPMIDGLKENNIIYTGTHDNETIQSWYDGLDEYLKGKAREYFKITDDNHANLDIVKKTMETNVDTCITPLQDLLGLRNYEGRMNIPSTLGINWLWRCKEWAYNEDLAKYLRQLTKQTKRLVKK